MDIKKEREAFEAQFKLNEIFKRESAIRNKDILEFSKTAGIYFNIVTNNAWQLWQAAKAQVPEDFVLVPKADLESWHLWDGDSDNMYRDHYSESICDDVELGAVFEIDAKMAFKVGPIYVVPIYSDSDDYEYEEFESEELATKAAAENKAMIEAQEQNV